MTAHESLADYRDAASGAMTEAALLRRVIETASLLGWHVHHSRPARTRDGGWVTHLTGHAGCPDLVLARDGEVRLVELKSSRGRVSPEQKDWLDASGGVVWRPVHWLDGTVERALR